MVSFGSRISLLICCLDDISTDDRGVLNSLATLCWGLYVILSPLVPITPLTKT
jgi:hypothetical protein